MMFHGQSTTTTIFSILYTASAVFGLLLIVSSSSPVAAESGASCHRTRFPCRSFEKLFAQDPTFYCFNEEDPVSVPWERRCDGKTDCSDGSDESEYTCGNCGANAFPCTTCASYCQRTCDNPDGVECGEIEVLECTCRAGYVMMDGECVPFEECPQFKKKKL